MELPAYCGISGNNPVIADALGTYCINYSCSSSSFLCKGMACRKMTNYSLLSQWPCYPVLGLTVRAFSCQYLPPVIFTIPLVGWWLKPSGSLTWCSREGFVWKGVNGWDAGVTLSIFLHSEACLLISFLWSLEFYLSYIQTRELQLGCTPTHLSFIIHQRKNTRTQEVNLGTGGIFFFLWRINWFVITL